MSQPIRPIVLSASAMAAAISTLAQTVHENPGIRIAISDPIPNMTGPERTAAEMHRESVRAAMVGVATEVEIRRNMGMVLPAVDIDPESMRDSWVRLASASYSGVLEKGDDKAHGLLLGPNADSTLKEPYMRGQGAVSPCYTNCHSACHGSRGWR